MTAFLLPVDVVSLVCDFLSSPQEILIYLSHLSRSTAVNIKPACFSKRSLVLASYPQLIAFVNSLSSRASRSETASLPSIAARIGAVRCFGIVCERGVLTNNACDDVLAELFDLIGPPVSIDPSPSPSSASCLFSSLSHLSIRCVFNPPLRHTRQSLCRLLSSASTPLTSLTSLDVELDDSSFDSTPISFNGLQKLRYVRLGGSFCNRIALPSVLSALWSLPVLETLDLYDLRCYLAKAAPVRKALLRHPPPASSSIRHWRLPSVHYPISAAQVARVRVLNDRLVAAVTRSALLESLTADLQFGAAGLSALLSMPSLRMLDFSDARFELVDVCQALEALTTTCDPHLSLTALLLLTLGVIDQRPELVVRFALLLPTFLARHTELRHLRLELVTRDSFQRSVQSLQQLQSLHLIGEKREMYSSFLPTLELSAPLSMPHLLEVTLESIKMSDDSLELLLATLPLLLRLRMRECVLRSWRVVRMAAHHCPQLRQLLVSGFVHGKGYGRQAAVTTPALLPQPAAFLPHLASLSLCQRHHLRGVGSPFLFPDLQPLIHPNNRSLHSISLIGTGLTSHDILSLSVLPCLSHLAISYETARVVHPQVEAAVSVVRNTALRRQSVNNHTHSLASLRTRVAELDVWDAEVAARRLSERDEEDSKHNLLYADGLDPFAVRVAFFHALQAEMSCNLARRGRPGLLLRSRPESDIVRDDEENVTCS